jgi:hypothetical protein
MVEATAMATAEVTAIDRLFPSGPDAISEINATAERGARLQAKLNGLD